MGGAAGAVPVTGAPESFNFVVSPGLVADSPFRRAPNAQTYSRVNRSETDAQRATAKDDVSEWELLETRASAHLQGAPAIRVEGPDTHPVGCL